MKITKMDHKLDQRVDELVQGAYADARAEEGRQVLSLIHEIRESKNYLSDLEFVAYEGNELVGYFMFSEYPFEEAGGEVLMLAPIAIKRGCQKKGIGTAMLKEGIRRLKNKKYLGLIVVGDPEYYQRFGFVTSTEYGILATEESRIPFEENLMAMELVDGGLDGFFGEVDLTIYPSLQ